MYFNTYDLCAIIKLVPPWSVDLHAEFVPEFEAFPEAVQDELLAHIAVLETSDRSSGAHASTR